MSGGLIDKVYIGLDNAPAAFDIKSRILGPNGTNLEYIRSETGVMAVLKNDKFEPLHLALHHTRSEALAAARSLALNLIETIRAELAQWSAAQAGGPPPALNVPPPALTTTAAPPPVPPPTVSIALSTPSSLSTSTHQSVMQPVVSVAPASTPLMTVRQPTVLQLLPQQQYVLNQDNGQLIPIVQPGMQVSNNNFTSLPISHQLSALQQPNFGATQIVDLSSMQPVNVTQLRLSGVPSSMSMILPNGLSFPQASLTGADTTTVSSATSTPVVCAAQSTNSSQKILYSTEKVDKDIKYHIQGTDGMQWSVPGSQTMLIPYQQLQELTSNQTGLANIQPQQYVSIAPANSFQQATLPFSAAQLQQLQATGTIMQLNQKPMASSTSLINIISTGQASSPQILSSSTPTKNIAQESRGQKRLSDGTPNSLQLRPIAPAGSHVSQDKSSRDSRSWTAAAGRDNTVVSMGMKINPAHGTIIHVSSGQQTNVSTAGMTQDGTGMYIKQIDRNSIQIQSNKDGQKQDLTTNKLHSTAQNVQMINLPQGMTVLQNPINISQMPTMIGQPNSQVYMIPANHPSLVQGSLNSGLLGQQVLQPGQNVTVMQPNQLGVPGGVQYNVPIMPMNMPPNSQYMPAGLNLNAQLSAQQLNAALASQQLTNSNLVSGTIPIVQAPPPSSPLTNAQTIPISQPPPAQQIVPQSSTFITPTTQYPGIPQQYMMQSNSGAINIPASNTNVQFSIPPSQAATPAPNNGNNGQSSATETDTSSSANNQANYISSSSQENGYSISGTTSVQNQPSFTSDASTTPTAGFTPANQSLPQTNYAANGSNTQNTGYSTSQGAAQPPSYPGNGSTPQTPSHSYAQGTTASSQNTSQTNFSPSSTPAPNQNYPSASMPNLSNMPSVAFPPNQNAQNPYPNATGQNMAAYANNQYQYTSRPWFRPRYGSPQGSPYGSGAVPPASGPPMVPPPSGNYNYWQDS